MLAAVLLLTSLLLIQGSMHSAAAAADRPGGSFDLSCGSEGMAACGACGGTGACVRKPALQRVHKLQQRLTSSVMPHVCVWCLGTCATS